MHGSTGPHAQPGGPIAPRIVSPTSQLRRLLLAVLVSNTRCYRGDDANKGWMTKFSDDRHCSRDGGT